MQTLVLIFNTLFSNILSYRFFTPFVANGICKVSFAPEFSAPQYFLNFRLFFKHFLRCYTLHCLNYFSRTLCRNRLYKEMNMVSIGSYFNKYHIESFPNFKTDVFYFIINILAENHFPVFCRTNKMIQQDRNIVAFVNILAHA